MVGSNVNQTQFVVNGLKHAKSLIQSILLSFYYHLLLVLNVIQPAYYVLELNPTCKLVVLDSLLEKMAQVLFKGWKIKKAGLTAKQFFPHSERAQYLHCVKTGHSSLLACPQSLPSVIGAVSATSRYIMNVRSVLSPLRPSLCVASLNQEGTCGGVMWT